VVLYKAAIEKNKLDMGVSICKILSPPPLAAAQEPFCGRQVITYYRTI